MRILVKLPTRERPKRFREALEGWVKNAADLSRIDWLFSFDANDHTMRDTKWIDDMGLTATKVYGFSTSKVHAINRDINGYAQPWDILLVLSDDMACMRQGWDDVIRQSMAAHYPDSDGLLWFFDGKQADICTLPIMGRAYYDRFGYVYNPSYASVFCDDEQTHVAKALGKLTFSETMLAEHRHPANFSNVRPDSLYKRNETLAIWKKDEANYKQRKASGFPQ